MAARGELRELFAVPGYRALFASSFIWHITRWGSLFTTSYLMVRLGHTPIYSQILGALLLAPMLFGGLFAGATADRFDRRRLILGVLLIQLPVQLVMFAITAFGEIQTWIAFVFMLVIGFGGLVNLTAQRSLIYETTGPRLATRAMPLESTAMASATMFGGLVGGVLIDGLGFAGAYAALAVLAGISTALIYSLSPTASASGGTERRAQSLREQLAVSRRLLTGSRRLVGLLSITATMNLFVLSYLPLVPALAQRFSEGALAAGALSAAAGCGQILIGAALAAIGVRRRGSVYIGSSIVCAFGLLLFAAATPYPVAWLGAFVLGAGLAGFGAMQAVIALETAGRTESGAALGLLSTAIGVQPLGMLWIGAAATWSNPATALMLSSVVGIAIIASVAWLVPSLVAQRNEPVGSPLTRDSATRPAECPAPRRQ